MGSSGETAPVFQPPQGPVRFGSYPFCDLLDFKSEPTWQFCSAGNRETAVGGCLCCQEKLHFKLRLKNEGEKKEGWTFPDLEEGASEAGVFDCLHHVDNDHFEHNQSKAKYDHNTSAANQ